METEVLLRVTLLCIVSNNSYTNVGNIGNITKSFLVYFYTNLIIRVLTNIGVLINSYLSKKQLNPGEGGCFFDVYVSVQSVRY